MKDLKKYLNPASKDKYSLNPVAKRIMDYFFIFDVDSTYNSIYDDVFNIIRTWTEENNVEIQNIYPCADPETVYELFRSFKKKGFDQTLYDDEYDSNENCQYEMSRNNVIEKEFKGHNCSIVYTDKCIGCYSEYGAIYCWKDEDDLE